MHRTAIANADLEMLEKARAAIQEVVAGRRLGVQAVPYFSPVDLAAHHPSIQRAERRLQEQNDYGNRVRAGIHISLMADRKSVV